MDTLSQSTAPSSAPSQPTGAEVKQSSKRRRTGDSLYNPQLVTTGGKCFLPGDLDVRDGIPAPPTGELKKTLRDYQMSHLETRRSEVHNQGVHLREDLTDPVSESQVLAIYEGYPARCRYLTEEESIAAGLAAEVDDPDLSEDDQATHELPQYSPRNRRQLIWYSLADQSVAMNRPPFFLACNPNVNYRDANGETVWLGVDAVDSDFPISNINSAKSKGKNRANVNMRLCLNASKVARYSDKAFKLYHSPAPEDYCFVIVATGPIAPGSELLLDYCRTRYRTKRPHFWGPDEYYFPMLSPVPVRLTFSADGATVNVHSLQQPDAELADFRQNFQGMIDDDHGIKHIICKLNLQHTNPLTGNKLWSPGCIQRLCEFWDLEHFRQKRYLTYLLHCLNDQGRLDNNGVNYLAGFIRTKVPLAAPPATRPETINDVTLWLKQAISQVEALPDDSDRKQEQLSYLKTECQMLETWYYRSLDDGPEKQRCLELERQKVKDFVTDFADGRSLSQREVTQSFPWRNFTINYLLPHELWPDTFRPSLWHTPYIRGMQLFETETTGPAENTSANEAPDPLDILVSYHPWRPEYLKALQDILKSKKAEGMTLDNLKHKMVPMELKPPATTSSPWIRTTGNILIPHAEGIPRELWGTTHWTALMPEHWSLLGFDASSTQSRQETLKNYFEGRGYDAARKHLSSSHFGIWEELPHIKAGIKSLKPVSVALTNYLIKLSGTEQSELTAKWQPLDTLKVCNADSPDYTEAMKAFLKQELDKGSNVHDIADLLSEKSLKSKAAREIKQATRIELPPEVIHHGKWTAEAVIQLTASLGLSVTEEQQQQFNPLACMKQRLQKCVSKCQSTRTDALITTVSRTLKDMPEAIEAFTQDKHLNVDILKQARGAPVRFMLHEMGIEFTDRPDMRKALALQPFDELSVMAPEHPRRTAEIQRLVQWFQQHTNYSLAEIAEQFNTGNTRIKKYALLFEPLPLPPGCQEPKWTEGILSTLMTS